MSLYGLIFIIAHSDTYVNICFLFCLKNNISLVWFMSYMIILEIPTTATSSLCLLVQFSLQAVPLWPQSRICLLDQYPNPLLHDQFMQQMHFGKSKQLNRPSLKGQLILRALSISTLLTTLVKASYNTDSSGGCVPLPALCSGLLRQS